MTEKSSATLDHHRALVRGFIDGTLSAGENAALEVHLRDADIARHFLRELHFDQAIRITAKSQIRRAEIEAAPNSAQPVTARLRVRRPTRWRPGIHQWSWARAATVLLIVGLSAWLILALPTKPQPAAELMVHLGTVEVDGDNRNGASWITEDQHLLVSPRGWASVRLKDGTLIELSGNTRVSLRTTTDGVRVNLGHGEVKADVRKQAVGKALVIESPRSRATVVGTRLAFATASDHDRLEVTEGLVRCARRSGAGDQWLRGSRPATDQPRGRCHS